MSETGKEHAIEVKTKYIASWSGGKDSMATIILAHENSLSVAGSGFRRAWQKKSRGQEKKESASYITIEEAAGQKERTPLQRCPV